MSETNPANEVERRVTDATRVPMSLPQQRLSAPEIPGYFTYWMKGEPGRISQALNAGYEWVGNDELLINNFDLGGDASKTGNSDMGSRVSVLAAVGGTEVGADGQPLRLYLMKIKSEWRQQDLARQAEQSESIADAIRGGTLGAGEAPGAGETQADIAQRYVRSNGKTAAPRNRPARTMFHPKSS